MSKNIKICTKCKIEKVADKSNFYWRKDSNKFRDECIQCHKNKRDEYRKNNRDKINEKKKEYYKNNKNAIMRHSKNYYVNNKSKLNKKNNEYKIKNKEEIAKKNKEYYFKNKNKINEYRKSKYKNDSKFKARTNFSGMFRVALKKNNINKNQISSFKILKEHLNYTLKNLKSHLESQFEPWMNWSNWGKYNISKWNDNDPSTWTWQIDHIIPQSKLPYDSYNHPNFKKCWELKNLRPYSAKQNLKDGKYRNTRT